MTTTIPLTFTQSMEATKLIGIQDLAILEGDLPPKAVGLVMEWAKLHRNELLKDWDLARNKQSMFQIKPLE